MKYLLQCMSHIVVRVDTVMSLGKVSLVWVKLVFIWEKKQMHFFWRTRWSICEIVLMIINEFVQQWIRPVDEKVQDP